MKMVYKIITLNEDRLIEDMLNQMEIEGWVLVQTYEHKFQPDTSQLIIPASIIIFSILFLDLNSLLFSILVASLIFYIIGQYVRKRVFVFMKAHANI